METGEEVLHHLVRSQQLLLGARGIGLAGKMGVAWCLPLPTPLSLWEWLWLGEELSLLRIQ